MEISAELKATLAHKQKFVTFSLAMTMLEKCLEIFCRYGVSPSTISFFSLGLERLTQELQEGYTYIKMKEEFESIAANFEKNRPET